MYDAGFQSDTLERAHGEVSLSFERRAGRTVLADLYQKGSLKARFPRAESGAWTGAILVNVSGGVAGGDQLSVAINVGAGAEASVATLAAERVYRARRPSEVAHIVSAVTIERGGACEWLPQETILFDRSSLERQLDIRLAEDARFLGVEMLLFGRSAMGERLEQSRLADTIRLRRGGRLVLHDAIRLEAAALARPAVASGMRGAATLLYAAPDAEGGLAALRAALARTRAEWGASAWDGIVLARVLAAEGVSLRAAIVAGLQALRGPRLLPRVWLC